MDTPYCYLCGKAVGSHQESGDHVVPKALIERTQPKVKGYDYAGTLPSHRTCNNEFGPEAYVSKALHLVAALHDDNCHFEYPHPANPAFRMMALKSTCLPSFTRRDLTYFKIIDATSKSKTEIHDLRMLDGRSPVNPWRQSLFTALTVLTKSAAALLVARKLQSVPLLWDVLAIPYVGDADSYDFDELFGATVPFDIGVKVWIGHLETDDYLVVYRAKRLVVLFLFKFSPTPAALDRMLSNFTKGTRFRFKGKTLIELVNNQWREA